MNPLTSEAAMGYKRGQIGRTTCEVLGCTADGEERILPAESLVEVCGKYEVKDPDGPDGKVVRYYVAQLSETFGRGPFDLLYDGAWDGFLTDVQEMPNVRWDYSDSRAALRQGWDIFVRAPNDDGERFELQAWMEDGRFKDDGQAWLFVWQGRSFDPLARKALAFLKVHAPKEYDRIKRYAEAHA